VGTVPHQHLQAAVAMALLLAAVAMALQAGLVHLPAGLGPLQADLAVPYRLASHHLQWAGLARQVVSKTSTRRCPWYWGS
jgi:hypothetical protein